MTAEDRLRDILHSEAAEILPTGDGLAKIQARIAQRRRTRLWLLPSAAVATAAAAAAFFLVTPDTRKTQTLHPGETPTSQPTTEPTSEPTAEPTPVLADDGGTPLDYPAIWPFTTQAQASAWVEDSGSMPWADNGLEVGRHFVREHLGFTQITVTQTCVSCDVLALSVSGTSVGELVLGRVGAGFATGHGTRLFTVTDVRGTDLTITTPKAGASVTSPLGVGGRITGVDENVSLRLLSLAGDQLAAAGAPAGSAVPWSTTLSWSRQDWSYGSVVGVTYDGRGVLNRVVAVPVRRSSAAATATFAALVDGHVALFGSDSGKQVRQLTYPPAGKEDRYPRWSAGTLVWIRSAVAGCGGTVNRLEGSSASTLASSTSLRFGSNALSPSGTWVAWTEIPCNDSSAGRIVVSGGGAPDRYLDIPSGSDAELYDVTDTGALLVRTNDKQATGPGVIGIVPGGALTLDAIAAVEPASGCYLASGASFDGEGVAAFETCGSSIRLVHFRGDAKRASADSSLRAESPQSISVRDGKVLVWLFGGDHYGAIAHYGSGAITAIVTNSGCSSTSDLKGCVRDPDW